MVNHSTLQRERNTLFIKERAAALGFSYCGVSQATFLEEEAPQLDAWLAAGHHGTMAWMEQHRDQRLDPRLLVPGAQSVVSLLLNYHQPKAVQGPYRISQYAQGRDYHLVIKQKLKRLLAELREEIGEVDGRAFVDSAPVMDKAWARRAGLGWLGKHTNLITRQQGSYFFIAELVLDLPLHYDAAPVADHCGTCTRCVDACPTDALQTPYSIAAERCISYLTIELKETVPNDLKSQLDGWLFGCDVCQQVCPWNRFSVASQVADFSPRPATTLLSSGAWQDITEEVFKELTAGSPLRRAGRSKLADTLHLLQQNTTEP